MGASRFPKERRLRVRAEFDRVQAGTAAARVHTRHFLVLATPRTGDARTPRLGIIASRRVGSAVRRNRAKRLVRQFFRVKTAGLGALDVVVVVKTGADALSQDAADAELAPAFAKLPGSTP
ncbi:MAG TPA: ribonuclease P protein component [bacterium]|nr:ribonuclease P protein component [bacterium]